MAWFGKRYEQMSEKELLIHISKQLGTIIAILAFAVFLYWAFNYGG